MKHFYEILQTLGASQVEMIYETPDWDFWKSIYKTPVTNVEGFYLYLKHKCPLREANNVNLGKWRDWSKTSGYDVIVTPRSPLAQNMSQTKNAFAGRAIRTSKQLLLDNFLKDFGWKPIVGEEYFIDPDIELSDGKSINDATKFLSNWILGPSKGASSPVSVLVANGGVGKTTVARVLCEMLRSQDSSVIPILVESEQWRNLLQSTLTMNMVWDLAIARRFDHAGRLLANDTALRVLVREGLFVIIFDGFDELCTAPGCGIYPNDIISGLFDLVTPEEEGIQARILLTARETFWDSIKEDFDSRKIDVFRLKGFDNEQRKRYFSVRLPNSAERDIAFRLSKEVSGGIYDKIGHEEINENKPSGVPFILDLIARYVHDNPDVNMNPYISDPFASLLEDICRRENKRQTLDVAPTSQLFFFEELFREYPKTVALEDFKFFLEVILNIKDPSIIQRFTNHMFLARQEKDYFGPRYEVLRVYFLARFLANGLVDVSKKSDRTRIVRVLAENSTGKTQILDWLLQQLLRFEEPKLISAIHNALDIIHDKDNRELQRASSMALFHIATKLIREDEKLKRTQYLVKLLNGQEKDTSLCFNKSTFTGIVKAFDFTTTNFKSCTFIDVEFKNCQYSSKSKFLNCVFDGTLAFTSCENIHEIQILEARCSKEAEFVLSKSRNTGIRTEIKQSFAEEALSRALKKFRGDFGLSSIMYQHRHIASRKGNPYNESIWKILLRRNIVLRHNISNVSEGGLNINEDKELRREIMMFLDNGVLGRRLQEVVDELTL